MYVFLYVCMYDVHNIYTQKKKKVLIRALSGPTFETLKGSLTSHYWPTKFFLKDSKGVLFEFLKYILKKTLSNPFSVGL